ncbi:trimeric intracellular cation channel family protein [Sediminibacterium soli]|uniref:trimeric intracellular cation channel family protein n=1 Tax=Sediminibacterium soli TaxID=2698829 RepID=UPI00137AC91B|nr:trimeric intracellular cation channel family protein [Sediminibacterium soli]NCI45593.1 trimeric intracellular cation channel family protein [Sediminibacterium soli]
MNYLGVIIYTGIFVFAIAGAFKARTHQMDIFGGAVIAFTSAYGGGTIRDLLIGAPINWMNDYLALALVIGAVIIVSFFKANPLRFRRIIFYTDAIGLGMFTAAGIDRSYAFGLNDGFAVVMGVITASFGGLVADVLCREIPGLLKKGELYATASTVGGILYVILDHYDVAHNPNLIICVLVVMSIRIFSNRKKIYLPEV